MNSSKNHIKVVNIKSYKLLSSNFKRIRL